LEFCASLPPDLGQFLGQLKKVALANLDTPLPLVRFEKAIRQQLLSYVNVASVDTQTFLCYNGIGIEYLSTDFTVA
jgi:hypothetical protein